MRENIAYTALCRTISLYETVCVTFLKCRSTQISTWLRLGKDQALTRFAPSKHSWCPGHKCLFCINAEWKYI